MVSGGSTFPDAEQLGVSHEIAPDRSEYDGGSEMAVYPFAHYTLEAHGSGHEAEANEGDGVVPSRARAAGSYTSLTRMPYRYRGSHGEQRLDHRPCVCMFFSFEFGNEASL